MNNITNVELTPTDLEHIMVALEERRNELLTTLYEPKANTSLKDLEHYLSFNDTYTKLACYAIATGMFKNVGQTEQELRDESEHLKSVLIAMIVLKKALEPKEPSDEAI